jgi:hypothetical protein
MAKQAHKSELDAAVSDALDALSTRQRRLLDAVYEQQLTVGGPVNLSNLAKGLGLADATVYDRMERALSEFGRRARGHAVVGDWLRAHASKEQLGEIPQREFTQESSRLGLYYHVFRALYYLSEEGSPEINSAGPPILPAAGTAIPLSECLASVDSVDGRNRVAEYLNSQPFPHYQSAGRDGLVIRIEEDGSRTVGRFVDRQFQADQC